MTIGIHHVGISVVDIDRSIRFYRDLLGAELLRQGTFAGGAMDRITRLNGTQGRSAMLRLGTSHLELFEFAHPTPGTHELPRVVCDHGISHFCLQVADLEAEYRRLTAAGVEFHCPPQAFGKMKATYARDPDGNVVELLEIPAGAQ